MTYKEARSTLSYKIWKVLGNITFSSQLQIYQHARWEGNSDNINLALGNVIFPHAIRQETQQAAIRQINSLLYTTKRQSQ